MGKTSNKQSNALVVADTTVPDALAILDAKIASMKHIQESVFRSPKKISVGGGTIDLETEKSVDNVVKGFAQVMLKASIIEKAYDELGITSRHTPKVDGATVEDWKADCLLRIQIIEQKDTLDELNKLKAEWTELMDKEDRKAMLVKKMMSSKILNS